MAYQTIIERRFKPRVTKNGRVQFKIKRTNEATWRGIKDWVFLRDGDRCKMCGSTKRLTIDHIVPVAWGGPDDADNLQVLCQDCNRRKGSSVMIELPCGTILMGKSIYTRMS